MAATHLTDVPPSGKSWPKRTGLAAEQSIKIHSLQHRAVMLKS